MLKFHKAEYLKDPFKYIKGKADKPEFFIAMIPLARNLIEYTKDIEAGLPQTDYINLTSCLHIKNETANLTVNDIEQIMVRNMDVPHLPTSQTNTNIKEYIITTADNLCQQPTLDEINIENKIVLSVAVRIKAEDYMIAQLKEVMQSGDFSAFYNGITSNQTFELTKKFSELCSPSPNIHLLLKEVNMITPENIHLNSFMFEPLIDMSVWRLKELYQETKTQLV